MKDLNVALKDSFASSALKTFDLSIISNFDNELAIKEIHNELEELLELNDLETMKMRHKHFDIPNSKVEDYREHLVGIDTDKNVLLGIRHVGGNINKPFINVWSDYQLQNIEDLKEISKIVLDRFNIFNPKDINLWLNPNSFLAQVLDKKIKPSLRYIVESVSKIRSYSKPNHYQRINLAPIKDNSYRKWYEEIYKDFHSKNKKLKDWVPVNDEEDMESCLNDGLLFYINIDGQKAGVIGGQKDNLLGQSAVYFTEILLSSKFKGVGLAPAVQRKFIDSLPNNINLVWGTIDAKNIPSTKTALKVGRVPIRNEYFVPLSMLK